MGIKKEGLGGAAQKGLKAHPSCLFTWAQRGIENRDREHGNSQVPLTEAGLMKPPGASVVCGAHGVILTSPASLQLQRSHYVMILKHTRVHGLSGC